MTNRLDQIVALVNYESGNLWNGTHGRNISVRFNSKPAILTGDWISMSSVGEPSLQEPQTFTITSKNDMCNDFRFVGNVTLDELNDALLYEGVQSARYARDFIAQARVALDSANSQHSSLKDMAEGKAINREKPAGNAKQAPG